MPSDSDCSKSGLIHHTPNQTPSPKITTYEVFKTSKAVALPIQAAERLFPYRQQTYPGRLKLICEAIGETIPAIRNWLYGPYDSSVKTKLRFANILETRSAGDLALAKELRQAAAIQSERNAQPKGFLVVRLRDSDSDAKPRAGRRCDQPKRK